MMNLKIVGYSISELQFVRAMIPRARDWVSEEDYYMNFSAYFNRDYISRMDDAFKNFESDESVFWYDLIPESAYHWPYRNYHYPFVETISKWNKKKLERFDYMIGLRQLMELYISFFDDAETAVGA